MKIDRLISVIMILLERQRASILELAKICEVSPHTISRDLETINQAGIPIVSYPGLHGGVGIMENYKMEKRLFSVADVTTLLMGLGCIRSSLSGQEVVNALAKVKGLIPEEQRREIELRAGRLTIDMTPWVGNSGCAETIETIQQALEQSCLLQFAYTDRQGQKSSRIVEPYRLLLKGMCWYLDGYSLERLEELFGTDIFTTEDGVWHTAQISLTNDARGYRFLLSFGANCVCIAPKNVRKNIADYLKEIGEMYLSNL